MTSSGTAGKDTVLRTEQLRKSFGPVIAVDGVSFDLRRGETHCLLGENGAGKSTLSACLYGFYRVDGGRIVVDGEAVELRSPHDAIARGIGMVHQHFVLVPAFSVLENVIVGTAMAGPFIDRAAAKRRVRALADTYDIHLDLDAEVRLLSVGEQQWVEILKALYLGARILVLDEPTAVLTPQESRRLFAIIGRMVANGVSVVLITHKLDEVMQSDRVTVLRKGKHVSTVRTGDVTRDELASLMLGHPLAPEPEESRRAPGAPVLEIDDLRARHERGHEVLRGLSFSLHAGEILGIAGVAGNGQSELFEVLTGVRAASGGSIRFDGADITGSSVRARLEQGLGHVPEDRFRQGLVGELTIAENFILGEHRDPRFSSGPFLRFAAIVDFAQRMAAEFAIAAASVRQPAQSLSGGNAQKLILARELWQASRCLLCNQPSRGLDVGAVGYLHRQLRRRRAQGSGILLASEDLEELLKLCDRIAVMFKGRIAGVFEAENADIDAMGRLMAGLPAEGSGRGDAARAR